MISLHIIQNLTLIFYEKSIEIVLSCTNFQVLEFMLPFEGKKSNRCYIFVSLIRESSGLSGMKYFFIFIIPKDVEKLVK